MGKVRTNIAFKGFSNNIDGLIYYERKGKVYVRLYTPQKDPATRGQLAVRKAFKRLIVTLKETGGVIQEGWKRHAQKSDMAAHTSFIGSNARLQRDGLPLNLGIAYGEKPLENFSAEAGSAPGEIRVNFTPVNSGRHVAFFTQKKENGTADGPMVRVDGGANTVAPYTIKGLEAGMNYFVYAVVTDTAYSEATSVSESCGALCAAG
jgi:hypothetical protein